MSEPVFVMIVQGVPQILKRCDSVAEARELIELMPVTVRESSGIVPVSQLRNNIVSVREQNHLRALVVAMLLGKGRIAIGDADCPIDEMCFLDCWCYETLQDAVIALNRWDLRGEPAGWIRHPASGRRRPDGDPAKEYVRP
ncbi:MAG: hypothetical protein AB1705_25150 [Verrucomicrobiota bacterium]